MDHTPQFPNPALVGDLAEALRLEEEASREDRESGQAGGPITSIPTLDQEIGGFLAPGIHTFLAAPGVGKTSFMLQVAARCQTPAFYVTSEMPRIELLRRLVARETGTYLGKLRGGQLSDKELRWLLAKTAEQCPMLALYDVSESPQGATCQAIQDKAEALRDRFNARHVLIVIDSVTDWSQIACQSSGQALNEYQIAEAALNGLKSMAAYLRSPIVAIAHRNRGGQKAQGADKLHAAKATGRYEYVAESVWDLDRDITQRPNSDGSTSAELTLLKNRHGRTGATISLRFEGRVQEFTESGQ